MLIKKEVSSIHDIRTWSGATMTVDTVIEAYKEDELMYLLEEMFPEGATEVEVNDFLWFESDYIYRALGMVTEDEEEW
ncbi:hypothetical protein P7J26_04280 [Streptococcus suis]|uniref:Uncharacterized protein n=1 Tax=Streptococcus suis TaxID=1307 RepID=A0A4T2H8J8_STRSU|nr:hypothetical protein [Streptococcus suis]NQI85489.1 hypothetical protein [Streptococcus suis]NQK19266.1 hypothetical protein [Streptococcus suis]TII07874.1 hypothetical protein FAJ34_05830 [Streptococcus suis]